MENIHICLAADNNYAPHAGVLVASILKHLPSDKKLNVHVLDGGISEQNKLYFGQLRRIGDFDVRYYPMNNDEFKNCPLTYLTVATYYSSENRFHSEKSGQSYLSGLRYGGLRGFVGVVAL